MNRAVPRVNAPHLVYDALTHKQKVKSLYKRSLMNLKAWHYPDYCEFSYHAAKLRQTFEQNRDIKDFRKAKEILEKAERDLFQKLHPQPLIYPYSVGGVCYDREAPIPDGVLDYWHPLEKAQYPHYFARREQRKQDYIKLYEEEYGDSLNSLHIEKPSSTSNSSKQNTSKSN